VNPMLRSRIPDWARDLTAVCGLCVRSGRRGAQGKAIRKHPVVIPAGAGRHTVWWACPRCDENPQDLQPHVKETE